MSCYLCKSVNLKSRKGTVRDAPELKILECADCGLVALSSQAHINDAYYKQSGMRDRDPVAIDMFGPDSVPIDTWLKDNEWDDARRFEMVKNLLVGKKVLDFGCGAGGFLKKAQQLAVLAEGVDLERRSREYWQGQITIYQDIGSADGEYDLITAFHVVEHLSDPRALLKTLSKSLAKSGRLVVEVPNSEDALLTLYDSDAFQNFTYWSPHLFLFNAETLRRLTEQAGLRVVAIQQYQRFPLSNHLFWLSRRKPGGQQKWTFLDSPELKSAYEKALAGMGRCDTLIAHLELVD